MNSQAIAAEIKPALDKVEQLRLVALKKQGEAMNKALKIGLFTTPIGIIFALLFHSNGGLFIIPIFASLILWLIIGYFVRKSHIGQSAQLFNHYFKHEVVGGIAKALAPEVKFSPNQGISQSVFSSCGHYRSGIDRFASEDMFHGIIDKTDFYFSECHAEYKSTSTDSDGNTRTSWHTIFKGVYFMADFHKHFNTWVTVNPDNETDGFFGWIGKKVQALGGNLIKLESPEFEKYFVVRSPDQITARYILTPDMQERLLELRNSLGAGMRVSFQNSKVIITIPRNEDWFETHLSVSVYDQNQISNLAAQIWHYLRVIDALNLNTRIWTKE